MRSLRGFSPFSTRGIVGNKYLVIGTVDRADWKRRDREKLPIQDSIEALHDFKEGVMFKPKGGWRRWSKGVSDEQTTTLSFWRFCPWKQIQGSVERHCSPGRSVRLLDVVPPGSPGRPVLSDPRAGCGCRC